MLEVNQGVTAVSLDGHARLLTTFRPKQHLQRCKSHNIGLGRRKTCFITLLYSQSQSPDRIRTIRDPTYACLVSSPYTARVFGGRAPVDSSCRNIAENLQYP